MIWDSTRINQLILHKQHLDADSKADDIMEVVEDIGGLHGQLPGTPYLSLFARMNDFQKARLEEELYARRTLARMKCIRRTLYIFPKHMISAVFSATRRLLDIPPENYRKYLGITHQEYETLSNGIIGIMEGRGLTTVEIKREMGSDVDISLIVNLMCDQGLLIRGEPKAGWKSNIHTYYPFNTFFPDVNLKEPDEGEARRQLVTAYISAFGPVSETDVSWWTGFPRGETKQILKSLEDKITQIEIPGFNSVFYVLNRDEKILASLSPSDKPTVNLLPVLDPLIMGYKERKRFLDDDHYTHVYDSSGNGASTVLVDGKVSGVWDFVKGPNPSIKVFLFEKPESDVLSEIIIKAEEIGRFIADASIEVVQCPSMIPLTHRTAGSYQSPLKDSQA